MVACIFLVRPPLGGRLDGGEQRNHRANDISGDGSPQKIAKLKRVHTAMLAVG